MITFVEAVCLEQFFKYVLTDSIHSPFGILVYNDFASRKTRYDLSKTIEQEFIMIYLEFG